ncbi:YIEGIA family protein [Desulfallas sp. Bu1-1]|nr:YIEGIA family protein [Desulfallas sp. Bu1-1]MBF7082016.1 YIEGIA family protein [Desulfallas sp. Bu1-1]
MKIILSGSLAGTLARLLLIRLDYRQYPGYPHGYISHLALGAIASALGAVAVPALLNKDFTAFTFLALAAQQFREIRNIERETLQNLEETRLEKRGKDYIEGIARTFEARNYLVMITAFLTSVAAVLGGVIGAAVVAVILIFFSLTFMTGETIGDICEVIPGEINFKGSLLRVNDIDFMSVGLPEMREKIKKEALGVMIKPKDDNARATLHDMGQRMAIAHTAAVIMGSKKDVDIPEFTPLVRKNPDTGAVALYIMPIEKDLESLILAVKRTPVLESARVRPLKTQAGRMAAD